MDAMLERLFGNNSVTKPYGGGVALAEQLAEVFFVKSWLGLRLGSTSTH